MSGAPPTGPIPPPPPTPGLGPSASSSSKLYSRLAASRTARLGGSVWAWRRAILLGAGVTYGVARWTLRKADERARDTVHDKTYLLWKIYDGGIVEAKSTGSSLNYLLTSSGGSPEEPPRIMTLFEVIRTLKFVQADDRIHGMIVDFSSTSIPPVPAYSLGLAQIEEIQDALLELRKVKQARLGTAAEGGWRTVAWTDTFQSQGHFLLASAFDEVYSQPTGEVPLVGMGTTIPFFGRLAKWLGIDVHAEARNEYKSFVQPYVDEKLTKPQRENQEELITDLNDNMMTYIARNRFPTCSGQEGLDKVKLLSQNGPYTASQAVENGLITGATYRQDVVDSVLDNEKGGDEERDVKGFYHYAKVMEKVARKAPNAAMDVGVVYLLGTIGDSGEFGTAAVVKGLKEAGEDPEIGAVVLRIDSGGGGVVESDTIWAAVRELRERHGKTVVASFANASASGGYLVSTHADAIFAAPSTITGSIGVASLRPTFLTSFFDRLHITLDSFYTGSRAHDPTHKLEGDELKRHQYHVDEMYADFKRRVCEGREIHPDVIDLIAGGRVMTGLKAFGLTEPKELIDEIKGLGLPGIPEGKIVEVVEDAQVPLTLAKDSINAEQVLQTSPLEKDERTKGVQLDADQDTSPFAIPASTPSAATDSLPSVINPSVSPENAETNAETALHSASPDELAPVPAPAFADGSSAAAASPLGPLGRGLVDGLGGIRDAAIFACEIFIANAISGYRIEHPEASTEEAAYTLLPGGAFQKSDNGEMLLMVDVRLKRFPVQKSFWQQFNELSNRGDAIDSVTMGHFLKATAATWMLSLAHKVLATEMEDLGLGDLRRSSSGGGAGAGVGLGNSARRKWLRAEWPGINLR